MQYYMYNEEIDYRSQLLFSYTSCAEVKAVKLQIHWLTSHHIPVIA
jgi:hypothetical protein